MAKRSRLRGKQEKKSKKITQAEEESDDSSLIDGEEDDGYPWFGCVCGSTHETFWIQCESCNAWHNSSPRCLGHDESEARLRGSWKCPGCSSSAVKGERGGKHNKEDFCSFSARCTPVKDRTSQPQHEPTKDRDRINQEDKFKGDHPVYSEDLKLLDNTELFGPHNVLTERSMTVCARLIMYYLMKEHDKSDFRKELWPYLWNCLRYEQKLNGWQGGWNSYLSGGTSGIPYYYIPKKSPLSNGKENFEYFTSKEGVVAYLCVVIMDANANAFDSLGRDEIDLFQSRLLEANDQQTSYDIIRRFHSSFSSPLDRKRCRHKIEGLNNSIIKITNKRQRLEQNENQRHKPNDAEITRLNQELLNAIATSDLTKCKSMCAKDMISYHQRNEVQEINGGLVRGVSHDDTSYKSTKYETDSHEDHTCFKRIYMTDTFVEWQGVHNDVAVLSYTRHDIDRGLDETHRKEIRIWTKKNNSWINTFTSTFPSTRAVDYI